MTQTVFAVILPLFVLVMIGCASKKAVTALEEMPIDKAVSQMSVDSDSQLYTSLDEAAEAIFERLMKSEALKRELLKIVLMPILHGENRQSYKLSMTLHDKLKAQLVKQPHHFDVIDRDMVPALDGRQLLKDGKIDALLRGTFNDRLKVVEVDVEIVMWSPSDQLPYVRATGKAALDRASVADLLAPPRGQYDNLHQAAERIVAEMANSVLDPLLIAVAPVVEPELTELGKEIGNAFDQALLQFRGVFNVQGRKEWKQLFNELELEESFFFDPKTVTAPEGFWEGIDALLTIRYSVKAEHVAVEALLTGISEKSVRGNRIKGIRLAGGRASYRKPADRRSILVSISETIENQPSQTRFVEKMLQKDLIAQGYTVEFVPSDQESIVREQLKSLWALQRDSTSALSSQKRELIEQVRFKYRSGIVALGTSMVWVRPFDNGGLEESIRYTKDWLTAECNLNLTFIDASTFSIIAQGVTRNQRKSHRQKSIAVKWCEEGAYQKIVPELLKTLNEFIGINELNVK